MLGRPQADPFGQGRRSATGFQAELSLQRVQAALAGFERLVEAATQADAAEEGGDVARVLAAAAVGLSFDVEPFGGEGGVVRFDVVNGPFDGGATEFADLLEELVLESGRGLWCDGLGAELLDESSESFESGKELFGEGQEVVREGGCQQEGSERRVSHRGVLSWFLVS
jgi:hypothetical protein